MPCACVPERVRALRATRLPLEDFTSEELATAINRGGPVAVDASTAPRQPRHTGKKSGPRHVRREGGEEGEEEGEEGFIAGPIGPRGTGPVAAVLRRGGRSWAACAPARAARKASA